MANIKSCFMKVFLILILISHSSTGVLSNSTSAIKFPSNQNKSTKSDMSNNHDERSSLRVVNEKNFNDIFGVVEIEPSTKLPTYEPILTFLTKAKRKLINPTTSTTTSSTTSNDDSILLMSDDINHKTTSGSSVELENDKHKFSNNNPLFSNQFNESVTLPNIRRKRTSKPTTAVETELILLDIFNEPADDIKTTTGISGQRALRSTVAEYFICTDDGYFPDPKDCSLYHICLDGIHQVRACEEDTLFNSKLKRCDWQFNVDCGSKSIPKAHNINGKSVEDKKKKKKKKNLSSSSSSSEASVELSSDKLVKSNHPSTISSTTEISTTTVRPFPWPDLPCKRGDSGVYRIDELDCRKYVYCQQGDPKVFSCKGGTIWNNDKENCIWPSKNNKCIKNAEKHLREEEKEDKEKSKNISKVDFQTTNGSKNDESEEEEVITEIIPQNITISPNSLEAVYGSIVCPFTEKPKYLQDPWDCSVYHACHQGNDIVRACTPGLYFNIKRSICDWPFRVKCRPRCPNNIDATRFVDPTSVCRYYECYFGRLVTRFCRYPQYYNAFNKKCENYRNVPLGSRRACTKQCEYIRTPDSLMCDLMPGCDKRPNGVYLNSAQQDCRHYYVCFDGRAYNLSSCASDERFNQYEGRCMPKADVQCPTNGDQSLFLLNLFHHLLIMIMGGIFQKLIV
ncbi:hypothetical protein SNEBB_003664 [Seison nebaliae]|nr:hypothetical protein SNEBB_003664 [Seison nebaliae]